MCGVGLEHWWLWAPTTACAACWPFSVQELDASKEHHPKVNTPHLLLAALQCVGVWPSKSPCLHQPVPAVLVQLL